MICGRQDRSKCLADAELAGERAALCAAAPVGRVDRQPMPPQSPPPNMRWAPGPPPAVRAAPMGLAGRPIELNLTGIAPGVTPSAAPLPDDIPTTRFALIVLTAAACPTRASLSAAATRHGLPAIPAQRAGARSGASAAMVAASPATPTPAATLACPLVSALDRWTSDGVQPAAMRWFGSQVVEIKQISSYSCRGMVGSGGSGISEHAFGNAIDIAAFTFADGRRVIVQEGWHGTPEEQGFLRDVHLAACNNFNTVLAPGYNAAHYNHIHVDLMRRASDDRPCRPEAMTGEMAAAKARALYAKHRGPAYTGSVPAKASRARTAVPGEDGYILDLEDVTGAAYRSKRGLEQHSAK
jgi:hypothetical protein